MNDLEVRKKMLVAECEVYREMLKLEAQNLRIYAAKTKKRIASAGTISQMVVGLTSWLTGKHRFGWRGAVMLGLLGWQWYQRSSRGGGSLSTHFRSVASAAEEFLGRKL